MTFGSQVHFLLYLLLMCRNALCVKTGADVGRLMLKDHGIYDGRTSPMAVDALKWAAYTYVIAAVRSLATLLYYIGIARSR